MAQHPLDMGRQDKPRSDSTLAVTVGADGNVNYDAIVKQGRNKDKYIATTHDAMVPKLDRLKDVRSLPTYLSGLSCTFRNLFVALPFRNFVSIVTGLSLQQCTCNFARILLSGSVDI